uniref:Uncharacterized protein n=1 Tax=Lotharella oceanica TaxID=641309 RepID=A0A7S2X896_9EUKA
MCQMIIYDAAQHHVYLFFLRWPFALKFLSFFLFHLRLVFFFSVVVVAGFRRPVAAPPPLPLFLYDRPFSAGRSLSREVNNPSIGSVVTLTVTSSSDSSCSPEKTTVCWACAAPSATATGSSWENVAKSALFFGLLLKS